MAGAVGWGSMVVKSNFNENPVVSLDLDMDSDLGFVNYIDRASISQK